MNRIGDIATGWHEDRNDPLTARYWDGRTWTNQRRWSGLEWIDVPLAPPEGAAVTAAPGGGVAGGVAAALHATSTTFKVFVGAAFACVLGYFVPVTTVTAESGYSEARSLTDAGGFGVLILAAAAATVWFAWPARQGVVSKGALWGLGVMVAIVALFTVAVFAALGSRQEDLVFTTASQTVEPSLGLFLLLGAAAAQVVGMYLAIRDRRMMRA